MKHLLMHLIPASLSYLHDIFRITVRHIAVLTNLNCLSLPYDIVHSKFMQLGTVKLLWGSNPLSAN
jgi:hypothetical protein